MLFSPFFLCSQLVSWPIQDSVAAYNYVNQTNSQLATLNEVMVKKLALPLP